MATATTPLPPVPAEVLDLVKKEGAEEHLQPVLMLAREILPMSTLTVIMEHDPEIPGHRYICIEADLSNVDDVDYLDAVQRRWTEGLVRVCPPTQALLFHLRML